MTVYAPTTDYIWELIRFRGIDPAPIFVQAGLDPEIRHNPSARINHNEFRRLVDLAAKACDDPAFGVRATASYHPSHFGALGYTWLTSSTLASALRKFLSYSQLVSDTHFLSVKTEGVIVIADYTRPKHLQHPAHRAQISMALFVHLFRLILGIDFAPSKVEFTQVEPADLEPFSHHFNCQLEFNGNADRIIFPTSLMERVLPRAYPELSLIHDEIITRYLADREKADIINQSKVAILEILAEGNISVGSIAQQLNISSRTLSRRLDEEGTSFRELLSDQRLDMSMRYIRDESLSLTEISYLLGFSEPSSFSRAYKGWTGVSPTSTREKSTLA
ncbi:MAG: AraC family transcriptional regulator [Xanthomonadales bacterium]|nr:AraC family transcriptional regulator [Xanthomonadales bacterium]